MWDSPPGVVTVTSTVVAGRVLMRDRQVASLVPADVLRRGQLRSFTLHPGERRAAKAA